MASPSDHLRVEDKDLLWTFQFSLTDNKKALTKFLLSVDWSVEQVRAKGHSCSTCSSLACVQQSRWYPVLSREPGWRLDLMRYELYYHPTQHMVAG